MTTDDRENGSSLSLGVMMLLASKGRAHELAQADVAAWAMEVLQLFGVRREAGSIETLAASLPTRTVGADAAEDRMVQVTIGAVLEAVGRGSSLQRPLQVAFNVLLAAIERRQLQVRAATGADEEEALRTWIATATRLHGLASR